MWFGVLGPLEVRDADGAPVAVGGSRARGLLVLLALDAGRVVPVERLIDGQYGEDPPSGAANAVQAQVSRLRKVLPEGAIAYDGSGYRLDAAPDDVDAHRFARLATEGRRLIEAGRLDDAVETLTAALSLWRGPALADLPAHTGPAPATRLDELRLTATEDLIEARLSRGDPGQVPELRRLVAAHPLRERPAGQLMRALHTAGRRAEALTVFTETRNVLADQLGTDPSPELSAVHQDILRDTAAPVRTPLPAQLTTFIARTPELTHLATMLAASPRLITITGPGGTGKTRLALEAAARFQAAQPHASPGRAQSEIPSGRAIAQGEARAGREVRADAAPGRAHPGAGGARDGRDAPGGQMGPGERGSPSGTGTQAGDAAPGHEHPGSSGVQSGGAPGRAHAAPGGPGNPDGRGVQGAPGGRTAGGWDVCLVDLSGAGVEQVAHVVLTAVGVRDGGYRQRAVEPVERLVAGLRERELLLVMDNCEHVIDVAAVLVRAVLDGCPGVRVLATSRESLGITGETLVPLAPLDAPEPGGSVDDALAGAAVRLFADRAAAVRPGFAVDEANVAAVARICAALDGLPLAIELAAARLRAFTVEDLADRLAAHERFALLSRGDRTAAARHRTLRSVVEWSWDLLTPAERTLARRFAVFTGGATLAAVEAVCGPAAALADLVDKSLLETDGHRYRMLDTIRLFCAEKLAASGEEHGLHARHAAYFLDVARRADPHLRRAEQLDWLAALSADHGNLMAALRWSAAHAPETGMRLVAALAAYWWLGGRRAEAGEPASRLLSHAAEADGLEEEYLMCVAHAVPRAAPEHWARGREVVRTLDGPRRYPFALAQWGMAAGPPDPRVTRDVDRILPPDPWNRALARLSDALLTWFDGVPGTTGPEMEAVLAEFRTLGERWGIAQCLDCLALLASWRGDRADAESRWNDALTLLSELGATEETVDVLVHRAEARCRVTSPDRGDSRAGAVEDLRRAADLARAAGLPEGPATVPLGLGELSRLDGDLGTARRQYDAALAAVEPDDWLGLRPRIHLALARLAVAGNAMDEARRWFAEAVTGALASPTTDTLITATEAKAALLLLDETSAGRAAVLLGAATGLRGAEIAGDHDAQQATAKAQTILGPDAYAAAYNRGTRLSRRDILAELTTTP